MRYLVAAGLLCRRVRHARCGRSWSSSIPANLAQAILIADRTRREYHTLLDQYQTIVRMAQGLGES